jgi:glutathione S-transferase
MPLEIYWGSGSPYAWRVLLALELKKLPYESKLLEFGKGEHKAPEYLKMNPRGRVPTLKEGDFVLYESLAILAYLDGKYPEPPLFGRTPEEAGIIWRHVSEFESYLRPAVIDVVRALFTGKASEKAREIREAADAIHSELAGLEAKVTKSPWFAGDSISAADIAVFPFVMILLRAAAREDARPLNLGLLPLSDRYPRLAEWMKRFEGLPGYPETYPPHWK